MISDENKFIEKILYYINITNLGPRVLHCALSVNEKKQIFVYLFIILYLFIYIYLYLWKISKFSVEASFIAGGEVR